MLFVQLMPQPPPVRPMPMLPPSAAATSPLFIPIQVRYLLEIHDTYRQISVRGRAQPGCMTLRKRARLGCMTQQTLGHGPSLGGCIIRKSIDCTLGKNQPLSGCMIPQIGRGVSIERN